MKSHWRMEDFFWSKNKLTKKRLHRNLKKIARREYLKDLK